jgi:hypothetical protein
LHIKCPAGFGSSAQNIGILKVQRIGAVVWEVEEADKDSQLSVALATKAIKYRDAKSGNPLP